MNSTGWPRWRSRRWSIAAMVVASVSVSLATLVAWTVHSLYDSESFSRRAGAALDSPAVQRELALQLTDQLVQRGNREVTAFRPAAILTAETLIGTDTFRSIFVRSVRETHEALLNGGEAGLDLSDSLQLLATSLRLTSEVRQPEREGPGPLDSIVDNLDSRDLWSLRDDAEQFRWWAAVLGVLLAVVSIVIAADRRRAVGRLGIGVAIGGAALAALTVLAARLARNVSDADHLREAVEDAVWSATGDLRALGLTVAAAALVMAAAAYATEKASLRDLSDRLAASTTALRATPLGTAGLALLAAAVGAWVLSAPAQAAKVAMVCAGLALLYTAARLGVSLVAQAPMRLDPEAEPARAQPPSRGRASVAVAAGIVLAVATVGSGVVVKNAVAAAEDDEELECLDSVDNCDLPLDAVTLAGAHNAMSASPYPGWLFAEQTRTLRQQLNDGVRALLIDAHYGRRSSIVVPGARNRLVLTDVAAELAVPGSEVPDPLLRERAEELAATAPSSGAGARDVYLCHNFCELGAVRMADELVEVRRFLDENPGELVVIVVQNAVSAGDAQAAFEEAGLASRAAILEPGEPLPTVSELLYAGTPLLVFAERADPDAADWYMPMYEWFQETLYTWDSIDSFTCEPNRGDADNPFMLINHWVSRAPPDPGIARAANAEDVLLERFEECVDDRGVRATIIAADFATSGDLVRTTRRLTQESAEALLADTGQP